jgi:hypothetical protein
VPVGGGWFTPEPVWKLEKMKSLQPKITKKKKKKKAFTVFVAKLFRQSLLYDPRAGAMQT